MAMYLGIRQVVPGEIVSVHSPCTLYLELLTHLGKRASPGSLWQCARGLNENVLQSNLLEDTRKMLKELAAILGHNFSH